MIVLLGFQVNSVDESKIDQPGPLCKNIINHGPCAVAMSNLCHAWMITGGCDCH